MKRSPPTPTWKLPYPPTNQTDPLHHGENRKPCRKQKSAWCEGHPPPPKPVVHEGSEKGRFVDKSMDFLIRRNQPGKTRRSPFPKGPTSYEQSGQGITRGPRPPGNPHTPLQNKPTLHTMVKTKTPAENTNQHGTRAPSAPNLVFRNSASRGRGTPREVDPAGHLSKKGPRKRTPN